MRIVQLVILVSSVYNSIQSNDDELMKLLPEFFVNATRGIEPHPDAGKDIYQILHDHGYKAESHWVTTEDGYVLRMQRIPNGKNLTDTGKSKPAVLLMHGMLSSSADWLIMGPNRSLAYMLADAGFDVWLGNNRGNTWSRNHLKLDPRVDAKEFWDFSFEDCGHYDLPAKIDYIIATTGQDRIFYVGHSQGTSQYFAMASLRPEYNDKIALMTALAPVAYMKHLASPLPRLAVKYMEVISLAADILKINELLGHSELLSLAARLACSDGSPFQEICATFLFFLCGFDSPEMERNIIPVLATNSPAGISVKMLKHYGQEIRSGFFRQYDYGGLQNLAKYNSLTPPSFNMSAATAPVALYYSHNDLFAAVEYQLLHDYGYPVETHYVFTEDGYVLRMQRILNGKNMVDTEKTKPAVLLMHGLLSGSADWLIMGPNKSLGYMLADAGFDVWLGNSRGSTWSRNHLKLDPTVDAKKFWDFSFEDCGHYDLPATIDHIIEKTGQDRIFYIGHSQGTSQYFAMASLRPEYNDKIALMTALAPVAYLGHLSSPWMRFAMKYMDILSTVADILNINEFLGHSELITLVSKLACSNGSPLQEICATFLFSVCGFDSEELDRNLLPVLATNDPAGVSFKMVKHLLQLVKSGHFRRYDYGLQNLIKYNSLTPPNFNMSAATAPVALYYARNDFYVAIEDVERLASEMPNVVKKKVMEFEKFNHVDFMLSKHIDELLNKEVVEFMREYLNNTVTTTSLPTSTSSATTKSQSTSLTDAPTPEHNGGYSKGSSMLPLFVIMLLKILL